MSGQRTTYAAIVNGPCRAASIVRQFIVLSPMGAEFADERDVNERRVLIVEDDDGIRALVELVAKRSGYLTSTVAHGADAIAALGSARYCAVVLDLMMPHVSGYDVILYIKENAIDVPVIVMTAAVKTLDWDKLDRSIVSEVVMKPFEISTLTDALAAACAGAVIH